MTNDCFRLVRNALACALAALAARGAGASPPRVYTNEDLDRVSARRGETGVQSTPGVAEPAADEPGAGTGSSAREEHWRHEASRVRERLLPLRTEAEGLEEQIASRRPTPGVKPTTAAQLRAWQRRLAVLQARIREVEDRLEESARRAHALPGWLR